MAIDSRNKRASIIAIGAIFMGPSVVPDGLIGDEDRHAIAGSYYGITSGSVPVTIGGTTQMGDYDSSGAVTRERVIGGTTQMGDYDSSGAVTTTSGLTTLEELYIRLDLDTNYPNTYYTDSNGITKIVNDIFTLTKTEVAPGEFRMVKSDT